jgi:hypothetical protein
MNWKAWKRGLSVAALTGLLTALVTLGVVKQITWEELALLLAIGAAKDVLLFLSKHPVEAIQDTQIFTKP